MTTRIGINGFGRIGRNIVRAFLSKPDSDLELVAVNDPFGDTETMAHLLKYDSIGGALREEIKATEDGMAINGTVLRKTAEKDPAAIDWKSMGVEIVIESSGVFLAREQAGAHLKGGAKKVIISAPSPDADTTVCLGVNDDVYDAARHQVISNASCTTNCLAPMARILHDTFGIQRGFITTVHAYTSDQPSQDLAQASRSGKADLRRMRAAALSIIPNTTGAAKAIGLVVPELKGKLDGMALRVPVPDGSITDLVAICDIEPSADEVNAAFRAAATTSRYQKILEYTEAPLVSQDIVGNPSSCVLSAKETMVNGNLVKILGWYDNEWGYSNRMVDLCELLASKGL